MDELRKTLDAFRAGQASVATLVASFDNALQDDPAGCERLLSELESSGWFPLQLLPLLEARIPIANQTTPPPRPSPSGDQSERTVFAPHSRRRDQQTETRQDEQDSPPGPAEQHPPETATETRAAPTTDDDGPIGQTETRAASDAAPPASEPPTPEPTATRGEAAATLVDTRQDVDAGAPTTTGPPSQVSEHPSSRSTGTSTGSSVGTSAQPDYPPVEGEPEVGALLRQRFLLEKVMGRGGMGVVFMARDLAKEEVSFSDDKKNYVAIKLLNDKFKQHPDSIKALGREFSRTQELRHPNIINLYDFDKDERGNYFIAMELLQGRPLNDYIRDLRKSGGLPFDQAFPLIEQMGLALSAAHNQTPPIIHSDFKPGNVFIDDNGVIKVFDFGIAQAARPTEGDMEKTNFDAKTLGALTPAYASLEMLGGLTPDASDDLYALAIVSYELLTGQRPFGRRTNAMEAKAKGLEPPRIKSLNRRQWRGLARGLAFDRKDRAPTVDAFLDALRPRRSQLPLMIAAGVVGVAGVGVATWLLAIDPWLTDQERRHLLTEIETAKEQQEPERLAPVLQRAAALPDSERREITDAVIEQLAASIAGDNAAARTQALALLDRLRPEARVRVRDAAARRLIDGLVAADRGQVIARLPLLEQLPSELRRIVIRDAEDNILEALIDEARAAFNPDAETFDYERATNLLQQADGIDRDSRRVSDTKNELESKRKTTTLRITEELNLLSEQETALLPADDGSTSVPKLLDVLTRINPDLDRKQYNWLISSYLDASRGIEGDNPTLAQRYVEQALALFPEDPDNQLRNQLANLEDLAQRKADAATLTELQARVRGQLDQLRTGEPGSQVIANLRQLRRLASDDPLLAEAGTALQAGIDANLPELLEQRDWAGARALVERWPKLTGDRFVAERGEQIRAARERFDRQVDAIAERIGSRIRADDLAGADVALAELAALAPEAPELARARTAIDRGYLRLARQARGADDWARARTLAQQGLERTTQRQLKLAFQDELTAIDNDEAASKQAMAEAERERREAERQARVAEIATEFETVVAEMAPTEADAQGARALLDRLGGLDPNNDLLTDGPAQIAARFVAAARSKAEADEWESAIDIIRGGQRVLPGAPALDTELTSLRADQQRYLERQRLAAIDARVKQVRRLIATTETDAAWSEQLADALAELARVADGDRGVIAPLEQQIGQRFERQISSLRERNLFTDARNQLQLWRRLVPEANADQAKASADLTAAIAAWEQAEDERRRQAEIAALTQTLRTQTEADQPQDAEQTLAQLRERLGDTDPLVTTDGPGLIADAYLRLAEQSAKRGVTDTALALVDKAAVLVPERDLSGLRERIELGAERDRLGALIASSEAAELRGLAADIDALRQRAPDDFNEWQAQWAKALVRRIEKAPSPRDGQAVLDAGLALFPGDRRIAEAKVPPLEDPPLIAQAKDALAANRLGAAEDLLASARRRSPEYPELDALDRQVAEQQAKARALKAEYDALMARMQIGKANRELAKANELWADAPWKGDSGGGEVVAVPREDRPARPTRPVRRDDPCNPSFAGRGRQRAAGCADTISGNSGGPPLVVIPAGGGSPRPFAITRYEISIGDYNRYCQLSRECRPISANTKLPLTGVTKAQADAYARWLSGVTGASYRLPTDNEWLFAARSNSQRPSGTANCLLRTGGQIIKGGVPKAVGTGPQNNWGLFNHVGNVQEWTVSGGSLSARGGYFGDDASRCSVELRRSHSGAADNHTGFRLVRDIKG
jgi:serine/threonine protein kinase